MPSSHTALFEDLASHGHAVLSIVHPYEATAAMISGDGAIAPKRAAYVTRQIVREYFDQELRGRRSALLAGDAPMPDVVVKKVK